MNIQFNYDFHSFARHGLRQRIRKFLQDAVAQEETQLQISGPADSDRTRTIIPRHRGIDAKFSKQSLANQSEV